MGNRKKYRLIHFFYSLINSVSNGKAVIKKDPLWHRYEVNRFCIHISNISKEESSKIMQEISKKLDLIEEKQLYFSEKNIFYVPKNKEQAYYVFFEHTKKINGQKEFRINIG